MEISGQGWGNGRSRMERWHDHLPNPATRDTDSTAACLDRQLGREKKKQNRPQYAWPADVRGCGEKETLFRVRRLGGPEGTRGLPETKAHTKHTRNATPGITIEGREKRENGKMEKGNRQLHRTWSDIIGHDRTHPHRRGEISLDRPDTRDRTREPESRPSSRAFPSPVRIIGDIPHESFLSLAWLLQIQNGESTFRNIQKKLAKFRKNQENCRNAHKRDQKGAKTKKTKKNVFTL